MARSGDAAEVIQLLLSVLTVEQLPDCVEGNLIGNTLYFKCFIFFHFAKTLSCFNNSFYMCFSVYVLCRLLLKICFDVQVLIQIQRHCRGIQINLQCDQSLAWL